MKNSEGKEGEATFAAATGQLVGAASAAGVESDLAARAARQDRDAWSHIFDQHFRAIYTFVRYRVRNTDEAEDLASQVFEVAFRRAGSFDYRGIPIEGWLYGIARNVVRDHNKHAARHGEHLDIQESGDVSVPDASPHLEEREDIRLAMQSLTEDQQAVLTLRFLLDQSVAETARRMNRSEDAVKTLQRRALAAMQRAMASTDEPKEGGSR